MARALLATLALTSTAAGALKAPRKAVAVRGGGIVESVTNSGIDLKSVGTALIGIEGLVGIIAPETTIKNYNVPSYTAQDVLIKRTTSLWLSGLAVLLYVDTGAAPVAGFYIPAAVMTALTPVLELLGMKKAMAAAWIPVLLVLGKVASAGSLPKWIAPALCIANGAVNYLIPDCHCAAYGLSSGLTPFGRMFAELSGSCMLASGAYLAALANGASSGTAFGYAYAIVAAAALKAGFWDAAKVGMTTAPMFVWGAISSFIAYSALSE
mmetsp:Transcript_17158/g.51214  ORF Transcript_17158/g.51214 Transcript_17158/m.51214 type:complete len:267 (+) Transcript_17158:131-931(+)